MLDEIYREFHLPSANAEKAEHDSHYRCHGCIGSKATKEQDKAEDDWTSNEARHGRHG